MVKMGLNAANQNMKDTKEREVILAGGPCEIRKGDVVQINFKEIDPTVLCMPLAVAMSETGRFFANIRCEKECSVIYINGAKSSQDLLSMAKRFNGTGNNADLRLLAEDMLSHEQDLDILNPVLQGRIIEYLQSETDVGAVIFDHTAALFREPFDANAFRGLRKFMVQLRKLGMLQIWALTHEKGKVKFPAELATNIWTVAPEPDPDNQILRLEILRDANRPVHTSKVMTLGIQETEDGLTLANASAERNDRLTAMLLVSRGKPGWPLQNPPPVATPKSPTCEGGRVGS